MTLADTSAWIAFLRGTSSPVADRVEALRADGTLATTEPVVMEVLAGAGDPSHRRLLQGALAGAKLIDVGGLDSWEQAAVIYSVCRQAGNTPRSQLDCLIAAVAIRADVAVLHADRDFDRIAACVPLQIA